MELNRALMAARLTMHAAGLLPHASLGPPGSGQVVEPSRDGSSRVGISYLAALGTNADSDYSYFCQGRW